MLKNIKNNRKLLKEIAKGLYNEIKSCKHSYKKNKVILPYHRSLALTIFTLYNGDI